MNEDDRSIKGNREEQERSRAETSQLKVRVLLLLAVVAVWISSLTGNTGAVNVPYTFSPHASGSQTDTIDCRADGVCGDVATICCRSASLVDSHFSYSLGALPPAAYFTSRGVGTTHHRKRRPRTA